MDTRSKIIKLLDQHPDLHYHGVGQRQGVELWASRYALLIPASVATVERVCDWLTVNVQPLKRVNKKYNSYEIKHIVQKALGGYVSSGQLTVATLLAGYPADLSEYEVCLGFPTETIRRLCRQYFQKKGTTQCQI